MIAVDTSAVVAILLGEPGRDALLTRLREADERLISAGTTLELGIVSESLTDGRTPLERVLADFDLTVVPVDEQQVRTAMSAWRRYGKGRHPAALNFGDCFSFALAETRRLPLLYVGTDFSQTEMPWINEDAE